MGLMIGQSLGQDLQLSLSIMLNPRMMQMLKVLNAPYTELIESIRAEAEENPLIEIDKNDRLLDYLRYSSKSPYRDAFDKSGAEKKDLEDYFSKYKNMDEYLLQQLSTESLTKKQEEIAKSLIASLDDNGYLSDYERKKELIKADLKVKDKEIDGVLELIQLLEPEGIAARNLKECLSIQARQYNFEDEQLEKVILTAIEGHLEALANKELSSVSKALGIPVSGVQSIAEFIKNNLNPYPGACFARTSAPAVPSFSVKSVKGSPKIENLEKTLGPQISLNQRYLKMLDDPKTDEKTADFLKTKLQKAKELLENLEKRGNTLEKVVETVVQKQLGYLCGKDKAPCPFSQKELAAVLGLHPSTISRSIAEKFVETPKGVLKLKSLFPKEVAPSFTADRVKEVIGRLIREEEKDYPLSDLQIKKALLEDGIDLDRRTVADYRLELGIGTAKQRGSCRE